MAARHARSTRPAARTAVQAPCRDAVGRRPVRSGRCVPPATPAPTLIGIITCRADFEELRGDGGTEYASFEDYLCDLRDLLDDLGAGSGEIRGRAFHPGDLAAYCERWGLSPDEPSSHTAYTADPTADVEWVRYEGESLAEFLSRLVDARERGLLHRRLERLLNETAEAALTGSFPDEPLRYAYEQGASALRRMLVGAGPGRFRLVCTVRPPEGPVEACADLLLDAESGAAEQGSVLRIEEADLDLLCSVLCTAHALGLRGSVLLSGVCEQRGAVAWGWEFDGTAFAPRGAADVLLDLSGQVAAWVGVALPGETPGLGFSLDEIVLE
jgi:hypothetical protein